MADMTANLTLPRRARRKVAVQRPKRPSRWAAPLLATILVVSACAATAYGAWRAVSLLHGALAQALALPDTPSTSRTRVLPFTPVQYLNAGIDEQEYLQIALGSVRPDGRSVALVSGSDGTFRQTGQVQTLPDLEFTVEDLAREQRVLVGRAVMPSVPAAAERLDNTVVIPAQGGEPVYRAWRIDPSIGLLTEVNYYELAAPLEPPASTSILVDRNLNVLWYYEDDELVYSFRAATGRHLLGPDPTPRNQAANHLTPVGWFRIANRIPSGMPYHRTNVPAGDPRNPVASHWMGFHVFAGDLGLLWGIHGTTRQDVIGRSVSDGSIWLTTEDAATLFERVENGTTLVIRDGR